MGDMRSSPKVPAQIRLQGWVRSSVHLCLRQDGQHASVHKLAEAHFMHIREAFAQESAPATLKTAFLEPVSRSLATDLSLHLFARTDQHFMSWFTCEASNFYSQSSPYA